MEKIKQDLKKQLITAVILTVSLPLGGVLLGVGLGIGQPGVWAVGIAFMVAGFYGCPIAWAAGYGNTKGLVRVVNAVRDEHLYTVQEISAQLGVNERQVRMKLDACFNKQYLTGFKREGDVIKANFNKDILGNFSQIFGVSGDAYTWAQPIPQELIPDELFIVAPFDEANPVASCRNADRPYGPDNYLVTVDGFIVSANVTVEKAEVIDTGFRWSDHNPVYMDFILNND